MHFMYKLCRYCGENQQNCGEIVWKIIPIVGELCRNCVGIVWKLWRLKRKKKSRPSRGDPLVLVHRVHDFQSQLSLKFFGGAGLEPFSAQVATLHQVHQTLYHVHVSLKCFESGFSSANSQLESFGVLIVKHGILSARPFGITVAMATLTSVCPLLNGITHGADWFFAVVLKAALDVFHVLDTRPVIEPTSCEFFEQFRVALDRAGNLIGSDVLRALGDTEVYAADVYMQATFVAAVVLTSVTRVKHRIIKRLDNLEQLRQCGRLGIELNAAVFQRTIRHSPHAGFVFVRQAAQQGVFRGVASCGFGLNFDTKPAALASALASGFDSGVVVRVIVHVHGSSFLAPVGAVSSCVEIVESVSQEVFWA